MAKQKQKAFTLIELLIVIAIIGLLASIVLAATNIARARARDGRRLADMHQIVTALDIYYDQNQRYPDPSVYFPGSSACGGYDTSDNGQQSFLLPLITTGVLLKAPADPQNIGVCALRDNGIHFANIFKTAYAASGIGPQGTVYAYAYYAAGSNGCPPSKGNYYVLGIKYMETTLGQPYPGSPGFTCAGKNWQQSFSWVIGKFENQ